jgi:hypothetical protein
VILSLFYSCPSLLSEMIYDLKDLFVFNLFYHAITTISKSHSATLLSPPFLPPLHLSCHFRNLAVLFPALLDTRHLHNIPFPHLPFTNSSKGLALQGHHPLIICYDPFYFILPTILSFPSHLPSHSLSHSPSPSHLASRALYLDS